MQSEHGQSLTELIIVLSVGVIIVGALTFSTISTLRNAQLAKNQSQATKYAQEALEVTRTGRDRNAHFTNSFTLYGSAVDNWQDQDLWNNSIVGSCNPCYFKVVTSPPSSYGDLQYIGPTQINGEHLPPSNPMFNRTILISDDSSYATEKKITAIVTWNDFSGSHESKQVTILRKI